MTRKQRIKSQSMVQGAKVVGWPGCGTGLQSWLQCACRLPFSCPRSKRHPPFSTNSLTLQSFFDGVSFETGSQIAQASSVVKTDLEPLIFLPLPPSAGNTHTTTLLQPWGSNPGPPAC